MGISPTEDFDPEWHLRERRRALPILLAWLVTGPLLLVALLRLVAHDATLELIVLNAVTEWLYLPAWPAVAVGIAFRRRDLVVGAGLVAVLHVAWIDPRGFVPAARPAPEPGAPRFRVMSANLLMINDDTEGIAGEIREARPDILLVQELSPLWQARFERPELLRAYPHRRAIAREDSFGIGLYSRLPLDIEELELSELPAYRAKLALGKRTLTILNVHTLPPRLPAYVPRWNEMMATVALLVRNTNGPLLLAGDLNATPHARWYGRLQALDLRGAHEERGRSFVTTWPNGRMGYPPIRLDHFLVSREVCVLDVWEGEGRGSDHRPIVGEFSLR